VNLKAAAVEKLLLNKTNCVVARPPAPHAVQPALQSDWLSFTSRPWVQGPVDAFLGNTHLAAMMSQHKDLAATVEGLVQTLDTTLVQVGGAASCSLQLAYSVYVHICLQGQQDGCRQSTVAMLCTSWGSSVCLASQITCCRANTVNKMEATPAVPCWAV